MTDVQILTSRDEVEELSRELLNEDAVAIDLEMDALHSYREKICLAQISTRTRTVILDPIAGADLTPLAELFASTAIRKIFHAVDYDLRSLKRDYGFEVHNLFDTMISAQFCGEEKIGLADLLNKYFSIELDKKYQRADWSMRPLPEEMIRYAAEDTRHLHRLAAVLEARLQELGRLAWLEEECRLLEAIEFDVHDGPLFLRLKGAGRLERSQLAIVEELLQWRDREAARRNRPHFKILGNKPILEMAQSAPQSRKELNAIEGINDRLLDRYGKELQACIARAQAQPEEQWPHFPRQPRQKKDPQADRLLTGLKKWRTTKAEELRIDPGVLINNALLEAIARNRPGKMNALEKINGLRSWQLAELGADLLGQVR